MYLIIITPYPACVHGRNIVGASSILLCHTYGETMELFFPTQSHRKIVALCLFGKDSRTGDNGHHTQRHVHLCWAPNAWTYDNAVETMTIKHNGTLTCRDTWTYIDPHRRTSSIEENREQWASNTIARTPIGSVGMRGRIALSIQW